MKNMGSLTIRQIDDTTKTRLRVRAARHGRSMEQEARDILRRALSASPAAKGSLAASIQRRFAEWGGVDLELARGGSLRPAAKFDR
jgi:antitoxin FitA